MVSKLIKKDAPFETEIERIYPEEPEDIKGKNITQNLSVSIPLFMTGFKDKNVGYGGKELLKKEIATEILLEMIVGKSTDFYQNLYEEGLINNSFEREYTGEKYYGFTSFGGESPDPEKVQRLLIKEINSFNVDENKFERIKKVIYGRFLRSFNNIDSLANKFTFNFFKDINLLDYINVYKTIELKDIKERLKEHFNIDNMVLSVIKPIE
jgi:predicted Zn-dependent peptidase